VYEAVVTRVVSGDMIEAAVDLGFHITTATKMRLLGVEVDHFHVNQDVNKVIADKAKTELERLILGQRVLVETHRSPIDDIWLCVIWFNGSNINRRLLEGSTVHVYKR
jgi:hypothetical protein